MIDFCDANCFVFCVICTVLYLLACALVGHECDLAVLTVQDEEFWSETVPLQFGSLPNLLEDVSVVGFPVGGDRYVHVCTIVLFCTLQ